MLDKFESIGYNNQALRDADVAHPVERHLAKVEVASSSLVIRSNAPKESIRLASAFSFAVKIRQISLLIFINILIVYSYVNYF